MKKRIVCVLLTLIMLLSLVPMGASAASHSTSEAAITVLKQMTKFESECEYFSGNEFRIGYGTVCDGKGHKVDIESGEAVSDPHTITEKKADEALRAALKKLDEKINSFASSNGLSLSQNEHDALVVFTYGAGESWLSGTGVLKNVIVNGTETNELLNAMSLWGNVNRRKVEANMYLNGVYSNTIPTGFGTVTYNPNEGYMNKVNTEDGTYVFYFDRNQTIAHPVTPTMSGAKFLGWYLTVDDEVLEWVPVLTGVYHNHDLIALWQEGNEPVEVNYKLAKSQLAEKNVYDKVGGKVDSKKASNIKDSMAVVADYIAADGTRWSELEAGGWVKVGKASTTQTVHEQIQWTVIVTNSYVNRRVNATAASAKNGSYKQGDELYIIQEDDGWLQVGVIQDDGTVKAVGWVSSIYTNWGAQEEGTAAPGTVVGTATVTVNGYLNVRQDAGTDHKIVGALAKNDTVELFEIKTVNGHQWGRTKSGWICLTYTSVELNGNVAISDAGSKLYSFTGKVVDGDMIPHVAAGDTTDRAQYKNYKDKMTDLVIEEGKAVTLSNLMVVQGDTWAKATWTNDELAWKDSNKKETVSKTATRSGWIKISSTIAVFGLDEEGSVALDPIKYTVAADTINARENAGNEYALKFTLNKGTEVEVNEICLVGENIWGHMTYKEVTPSGTIGTKDGWINLASKYVTRGNVPTVEEENHDTGKFATVINTDSLKVRKTGATYGAKIGSLSRGTTVAVWESNSKNWYKVDSNQNGVYDYDGDGWVSGDYLEIHEGTAGNSTVTDAAGNQYQTDGTGKGIVANTYSGVNVRTGPSTAYASNGKLLPGTVVEILEVSGNGKWGRTAQGWVSLDYITMVSYNESVNNGAAIPEGGIQVDSFADADRTSTTAVYTGKITADGIKVYAEPDLNANVVRTAAEGANVTVHELSAVTKTIKDETVDEGENTTTVITKKVTTYWARINDGWVNLDPEDVCIALDALDEKVHTVTGAETLNVRPGVGTGSGDPIAKLKKGDQVVVTKLEIENDKVWGRIETDEKGTGYVRLDYLSEGAIYETPKAENTTPSAPTVSQPVLGNGSDVGGYVTNTSGYRYTGKVIRANEVNVRSTPSTAASKTTSLKNGQALVIYETTVAENMAWGRCDAGWIYLYYVDLTPVVNGAVDARVVYNDNTIIYTDVNGSAVAGTYARMSTIDIYEIVGKMARTDLGWVNVDNLL